MPKVQGAILKFIPTNTAADMIQQGMGYTEPPTEFYEASAAIYASANLIANGTMLRVKFVVDPAVGENSIAFIVPLESLQDGKIGPTRNECLAAVTFSFTNVYLEFHEIDTDEVLEKIGAAGSSSQFYREATIPGNVFGNDTLLESYDITSIYRSFFADFMYAYTNREAPNPGGGGQQIN